MLDSTQHWLGTNDVLMSVYDARRAAPSPMTAVPLLVELQRRPTARRVRAQPAVEQFATYGRRLYRARVPLDGAGPLGHRGQRRRRRRRRTSGTASLDVSPDMGTPALGSLVPGGETPTMRDAHSLMHHISSDPEPLTAFYTWSLDDALAQGQPTVFVMDSYAFRPNAACGGALGILHEVFIDYPGLTIIHAEPWHMAMGTDGHMLELDPPGGPGGADRLRRGLGHHRAALGLRHRPRWPAARQVHRRHRQRRAARGHHLGDALAAGGG